MRRFKVIEAKEGGKLARRTSGAPAAGGKVASMTFDARCQAAGRRSMSMSEQNS